MPKYKFIEPNSKIQLNGKWYNDSNLDNEVVSDILKHKPSLLGSVFVEIHETTLFIKNEVVKEPTIAIDNGKHTETKVSGKAKQTPKLYTDASKEAE